ncbi:hypothetical protein [Variovorax boronicumulans]|uniref:hypothetical protein n=1 Tax=Variovorax boronicumulans TaxID=436515 RepID=UPI0012E5B233|nr:hypothetical protein [Variovorax boronicumulans]GER16732.1 hypothetical protein VCH24_17390 [Variovorax boronicumulans]
MHKRTRDITTMAEVAGLVLLRTYSSKARLCADARAPNGVEMTFSLSTGTRSDVRGDLNEQAKMKRFARLNPAPVPSPTEIAARAIERAAKPSVEVIRKRTRVTAVPAPLAAAPITAPVASQPPSPPSLSTMTTKIDTPANNPVRDFTPAEFYRLCEWLKAQDLKLLPSFDALVLVASQKFGQPVSEATLKEAITVTERVEPEHWSPPTDPTVILADALATFMRSLGVEPPKTLMTLLQPALAEPA